MEPKCDHINCYLFSRDHEQVLGRLDRVSLLVPNKAIWLWERYRLYLPSTN